MTKRIVDCLGGVVVFGVAGLACAVVWVGAPIICAIGVFCAPAPTFYDPRQPPRNGEAKE